MICTSENVKPEGLAGIYWNVGLAEAFPGEAERTLKGALESLKAPWSSAAQGS